MSLSSEKSGESKIFFEIRSLISISGIHNGLALRILFFCRKNRAEEQQTVIDLLGKSTFQRLTAQA